ncbi:MAG: hypothetical protein ACLUTO_11900 [Anaerostipes sp.]
MKKTRCKLLSILMAATISATMLLPQAKVSASEDAVAKSTAGLFSTESNHEKSCKENRTCRVEPNRCQSL